MRLTQQCIRWLKTVFVIQRLLIQRVPVPHKPAIGFNITDLNRGVKRILHQIII